VPRSTQGWSRPVLFATGLVTIPAAGEYAIEVFDNGSNQRGGYSVGRVIPSADFNDAKPAVGKLVPARCGPGCTPPFDAPGKASCVGPACAAPIP
jgi:hypothetical protein